VLCLWAPLDVRLRRNHDRGAARIPPDNLAGMSASLSPSVAERVVARVQDFRLVDTDTSLSRLRELSTVWVEESLDRALAQRMPGS
jgi:hypothetical protein